MLIMPGQYVNIYKIIAEQMIKLIKKIAAKLKRKQTG